MTRNTIQDNQGKERVESWLAQLSENGYRLTAPRKAVVDVVAKSGRALAPAQVYELARARYTRLGLVTVYRTLDLLSGLGLVRRIHAEDGCHGYVVSKHGHHHHLICRQCGTALEFEGCDLFPFLSRVGQETGYVIEEHLLELVGVCEACQ